jgi:hypothetical protein
VIAGVTGGAGKYGLQAAGTPRSPAVSSESVSPEGGAEMISLSGAVTVIIYLVVAGLIFWLLWWLVGYTNPPEPFKKIASVILAILAVLVIIGILLSLVNNQPLFRP